MLTGLNAKLAYPSSGNRAPEGRRITRVWQPKARDGYLPRLSPLRWSAAKGLYALERGLSPMFVPVIDQHQQPHDGFRGRGHQGQNYRQARLGPLVLTAVSRQSVVLCRTGQARSSRNGSGMANQGTARSAWLHKDPEENG